MHVCSLVHTSLLSQGHIILKSLDLIQKHLNSIEKKKQSYHIKYKTGLSDTQYYPSGHQLEKIQSAVDCGDLCRGCDSE